MIWPAGPPASPRLRNVPKDRCRRRDRPPGLFAVLPGPELWKSTAGGLGSTAAGDRPRAAAAPEACDEMR